VFFAVLLSGCSPSAGPREYSRSAMLMGTFVQIKVIAPELSRTKLNGIVKKALEEARGLEARFSIFNTDSEINALNLSGEKTVSPELYDLINEAGRVNHITGGGFDLTVTPVLKARGFYRDMPQEIHSRIPEVFDGVGWENVIMNADARSVKLCNGAWIDASGIAKGYIVDRMASSFRKEGLTSFLINAGGDIYCAVSPGGVAWKIGIRYPGENTIALVIAVKNLAVVTSGDYENVVMDESLKEEISHIIDPSRCVPGKNAVSSVTVIAPSCTEADGLATGMMVLGRPKAIALADALENVEAIWVECPAEAGYKVEYSASAEKYIVNKR